jgi:gamma-glutamylcysteine synthetase
LHLHPEKEVCLSAIYNYFYDSFKAAVACSCAERRIGAELKFPLVSADGSAAGLNKVHALWDYLLGCGWQPVVDRMADRIVGAKQPGQYNDTVASCETGFCKIEFSLAHVTDLFDLDNEIKKLLNLLEPFSEHEKVFFLGYGIQPLTPPGKQLLMKKGRSSVWDKVFPSNRYITPENGDDVHLFTINAANHVHISVTPEEAVQAVNVLNGFAGPQIALTAHSNIWKGAPDPDYKCVSEKLWDWWMDDADRIGVPAKPFPDLHDYINTVAAFRPVFVMRNGQPIVLTRYRSFYEYFTSQQATGFDPHGETVSLLPEQEDFDLHCTCYWYSARISRYFTVENRVNDQQPPDEIITIPALTLGLLSALEESWEEVSSHDWETLRCARDVACRNGLDGVTGNIGLLKQAKEMLDIAQLGLIRRGRGEEKYLFPLYARLRTKKSPADEAAALFHRGGIKNLVNARKL